jgi:hypothetical protein
MHFWPLTVFSITEGIKKTGGVFEIFSVNWKFQFDFTDEITDKIFKNNNI